ncbi:hypothetical protein BJ742DRAFT_827696 [Cladochytrium replicatum]|nr:hypothetical protein BJ742DRAFT_827696 [Cladochytrium replicatum]
MAESESDPHGAPTVPRPCFFYGTLMSPRVYSAVMTGLRNGHRLDKPLELPRTQKGVLHGYRRKCVRDAVYPAMVPSEPSHSVTGVLAHVQSYDEVKLLDIFEGSDYERRVVRVSLPEENGREVEAEVYVWIAGEDQLIDEEWSFEKFGKESADGFLRNVDEFDSVDNFQR